MTTTNLISKRELVLMLALAVAACEGGMSREGGGDGAPNVSGDSGRGEDARAADAESDGSHVGESDGGTARDATIADGPANDDAGSVDARVTGDGAAIDPGLACSGGDCRCTPGRRQWCEDGTYGSWGTRFCQGDGSFGPCAAPMLTLDGLADRPATTCGCRYFYFNDDCCEDQADRDMDGVADCILPAAHAPPECPSDGSLCSTCDSRNDCGDRSGDDFCVFLRDGAGLCSHRCARDADCPEGFACESVTQAGTGTRANQCVPITAMCF